MFYWQHHRHIEERREEITRAEQRIAELQGMMEIEALQLAGLGLEYVPTLADSETGELGKYMGIAEARINHKHGRMKP